MRRRLKLNDRTKDVITFEKVGEANKVINMIKKIFPSQQCHIMKITTCSVQLNLVMRKPSFWVSDIDMV